MSLWAQCRLRFHYLLCLSCRRFSRQTGLAEKAFQDSVISDSYPQKLSEDSRVRIQESITKALFEDPAC